MQQTVWLARHGNRLDFVTPEWFNTAKFRYDPPLSEDGVLQAVQLAEKLKTENIKHIYSSPYLRTIQTAHPVAEVLSASIKVEAGLGEWQNPDWMPSTPELNPLEVTAKQYPYLDLSYTTKVVPQYPEKEETLKPRIDLTIKNILSECGEDLLIVTHSAIVRGVVTSLLNTECDFKPSLCCLIKLVRQKDNWQMQLNGTSSNWNINLKSL